MKIMDIFPRKKEEKGREESALSQQESWAEPEEFVSDISMFELANVDWAEFVGKLKQYRAFPNSYIKQPSSVVLTSDNKNRPMVVLEFKSATSSSVRELTLLQDDAFQTINGVRENAENKMLVSLWTMYRDEIRYRNMIETNREGYFHKQRGERLARQAEKMIAMADIYEREQAFLQKFKDTTFVRFENQSLWSSDGENYGYRNMPQFAYNSYGDNGYYEGYEYALPFSPKTLEFCILHMSDRQKADCGECPDQFEKDCRKIQEYSCYESDNWDKVIDYGTTIVRRCYRISCISSDYEME